MSSTAGKSFMGDFPFAGKRLKKVFSHSFKGIDNRFSFNLEEDIRNGCSFECVDVAR